MQDREFDNVFRDKFETFEFEPSPAIWENINSEMGRKRKRKLPFVWLAAASVTVLIGAGVMLRQEKEPMKLYSQAENPGLKDSKSEKRNTEAPSIAPLAKVSSPEIEASKIVPRKNEKVGNSFQIAVGTTGRKKSAAPVDAGKARPDHLGAENQTAVFGAGSVGESAAYIAASGREEPATVLAAQEPCVESYEWPGDGNPKRKIKSVGDLVNFVVSKVDKRKDKIIEFTDEDEGSIVSGINLGLVHFKSKDNKLKAE